MAEGQSTLWDTGDPVKRCPTCRLLKLLADFSIRRGRGRTTTRKSNCRICLKERQKAFFKKHGRKKRKVYNRKEQLKRYGLTPEDYERMVAEQHGVCAIFKFPPTKHMLAVDHNHKTGAVRGLLCPRCNPLLGNARENHKILMEAIRYLEKHNGLPKETSP